MTRHPSLKRGLAIAISLLAIPLPLFGNETATIDANGNLLPPIRTTTVGTPIKLPDIYNRTPKEIWISADRSDDKGKGTQVDPYDGSTRSKFDAVMTTAAALGDGLHVHLCPGVFKTSPVKTWLVKSNQTFEGAGMYSTTVQLDGAVSFSGVSGDTQVFKSDSSTPANNVTIKNLTVDDNWAAFRLNGATVGAGSHTVSLATTTSSTTATTATVSANPAVGGYYGFLFSDVGRTVSGTGIQSGTTIASVNSLQSIVLSLPATGTATVTATIGGEWNEFAGGILIFGSNIVIDGVRAINFYGSVANGTETPGIFTWGVAGTETKNNEVRNCRVELPAGNYSGGISIGGRSGFPATNCKVTNCQVIGVNNNSLGGFFSGGVNSHWTNHLTVENCTFTDVNNGALYHDTGSCQNLKVINCKTIRGWGGVVIVPTAAVDHIEVQECTFQSMNRKLGADVVGIQMSGSPTPDSVTIRNTSFATDVSTGVMAGAVGIPIYAAFTNSLILDNVVEQNWTSITSGAFIHGNKVLATGGTPGGLPDSDATARVTTQFDKTNTTLANVTGLTANVVNGKTYSFRAVLYMTLNATGGGKVAIGGTATATAIRGYVFSPNESDPATSIAAGFTALGSSVAFADNNSHLSTIDGTITASATGTLTVQFAQNSAPGTSSVLVGSTFKVTETP